MLLDGAGLRGVKRISWAQLLATRSIKTLEVTAYWPRAKLDPLYRIS